MAEQHQQLTERLRELRRRHFGPRGKAEFARRLSIPLDEYERLERGALPSGELLVRICELTGEDLQWLLTGREARQSLVISGTRRRHRDLIARIASLLDERPACAGPLEGFVDLLCATPLRSPGRALPGPSPPTLSDLVPILDFEELPLEFGIPGGKSRFWLPPPEDKTPIDVSTAALTATLEGDAPPAAQMRVVTCVDPRGHERAFLQSREVLASFPDAFAVRIADDAMTPLIPRGTAVIVAPGAAPELGRPALCRTSEGASCRVWLGIRDGLVHLGRASDGSRESLPQSALRWSLAVLFRLAPAA